MSNTISTSNSPQSEVICYITDIVIQCPLNTEEGSTPPATSFEVLSSGPDTGETLLVVQTSPSEYLYTGIVELKKEITFVATWKRTGESSKISLRQSHLEGGLESRNPIARESVKDVDGLAWRLKFHVYTIRLDTDIRGGGDNDLLFSDLKALMAKAPETIFTMVKGLPDDIASKPRCLYECGSYFLETLRSSMEEAIFNNCVLAYRLAVHLTPEGHPEMPIRLNNFGISLRLRFERAGDLTDLLQAITYGQQAVHLTPEGHADMPIRLGELGFSLLRRYEQVRDLADLSEAIAYQRKAIHLALDGHASTPMWLNNLGQSLQDRFEELGDLADLSEAIASQRKAIYLTLDGHADMPIFLSTLGNLLGRRFGRVGDLTDLSEAITSHRKAVRLTPKGHANMPIFLSHLAHSLEFYFEQGGDLADLSESITHQLEGIRLTPENHPDMPFRHHHVGCALQCRFEFTADPADNQSATSHFWKAATYPTGAPFRKLLAAEAWIQYSEDAQPEQLLKAYEIAITLISEIAGLEQTIEKRHSNLLDISNLSCSAASAAFRLDRHDLALEWLEQGRCSVWSQLNNLRAPIDALQVHDPALAKSILGVSRALETAGYRESSSVTTTELSMAQKISREDEVMTHLKLSQKWDQLLSTIHAIPEFEDFLRPLSYNNLIKNLPDSGTVIVINVYRHRADALAIGSSGKTALHIPLPSFSYYKADELRTQLTAHLHSSGVRMRASQPDSRGMRLERDGESGKIVTNILKDLWNLVVKPILDRLGYNEPPSELFRIWWCTTGPLAFLPIHAAGIYANPTAETSKGPTLSDFAISSYTPTVRVLVDRIKAPRITEDNKTGLFLISQPHTPKLPSIPGTTKEVRAIGRLLKTKEIRALCLESEAATIDEGIKNMENHSCIHFACHARQETDTPLKSGFALHDGQLELSMIIKQQLPGADLAFLSACQTSTGDEKLSEEAVHLAAGMLAAGYRGVIATMWSINDSHAPKIAQDFYENLIGKQEKTLTGNNAARALHQATQNLRRSLGDSESALMAWVPYVHFGV